MNMFLGITSLLCAAACIPVPLQQTSVSQKEEFYSTCVAAMKTAPVEAEKPCTEYLQLAAANPEEPQDRFQCVKDWLAEYSKLRPYVQFLWTLAPDPKTPWIVYPPDMNIELPQTSDTNGSFKIQISRSFADPSEEAFLRKAEAVYPGPHSMVNALLRGGLCEQDLHKELAPIWGACGNDNIEMTSTVTARAVRYYYDLTLLARTNPELPSGFTAVQTDMQYAAGIQFLADYAHDKESFHDVYVADLNLKWGFNCGGLCGVGFTRNKVVVLDRQGNVLALYLDAPVNHQSWVS